MFFIKKASVRIFFVLALLGFSFTHSQAQELNDIIDLIIGELSDKPEATTAMDVQRKLDVHLSYPDTVVFNEQYLPLVFKGKYWDDVSFVPESPIKKPIYLDLDKFFPKLFANNHNPLYELQKRLYTNTVINRPDLIKYSLSDFPDHVEKAEEIKPNIFQHLFAVEVDLKKDDENKPERFAPKRKYWRYDGNHIIQFNQYHYSENWHKGGSDFLNLFSDQTIHLNYRKNKVEFNNEIRWKLNLINDKNDTIRNYRIGEDFFRTYSTFSIKAVRNWSYLTSVEIKTQLLKRYKENSTEEIITSFLTPIDINMGILGMKYNISKNFEKKKLMRVTFNADISPLSVNYRYVDRKDLAQKFGIEEGKKHKTDFGSLINSNFSMTFKGNISFSSRFKYFTTFHRLEVESENTLNMPLNRYFSTRFILYARFDDSKLDRDKRWGYVQVHEMFSFGFNYTW